MFALGRQSTLGMLRTLRQTLAADPDPRGRRLYRRHDLPETCLVADRPQAWQIDGDHMGLASALRGRTVADALRVVRLTRGRSEARRPSEWRA